MTPSLAEIEVHEGVVVARPLADVDMANAETLRDTLEASVPNTARGLVVDLTRSRYVDSAGIRVLFSLATRLRMRQQDVRLVVPASAPLRRILGIVGLDESVAIETTLADALAGFADVASESRPDVRPGPNLR